MASKNDSGIVRLWDVASGKLVRALKSPSHGRGPFAFAPDGKTLASATEKLVCFWEPDTGRLMRQLEGHDRLTSIAFSPNNQLLATGGFEGAIVLWDAPAGKVLHTLKGHRDGPTGLVFTPDNKTLASTGYDGTTRLWDVAGGKELFKFAPNKLSNSALLISADGKTLISPNHDGIIRYFDVADRREVRQIKADKHLWSLALSKDGKLLAAGGSDGVIRLHDADTAAELGKLPELPGGINAISLSPDGETIAWAIGSGYRIHLGKITGLPKKLQFKELFPRGGHEGGVGFVSFSGDGKKILSTSHDNTAIVWDEASGKELHRFRGGPLAAWSHDGKLLALADASDPTRRAFLLFDADTGKDVGLVFAPAAVVSIEFSVNRTSLIVACSDGGTYLSELATGQVRARLQGKPSPFWRAVLAPDGLTLATTGPDVRILDTITGSELARLPLAVTFGPLAFSPDGKTLACRDSKDKAVVLWDLRKDKEIRRINHLTYSLAFTPDGQTLAGACQDESIRLWDVATGKQRHEFRGHGGWIHSVAVSPDGRTLASGSIDTTLLLWTLNPFVKGKPIVPARLPAQEFQARLAKLPAAKWEQCWKELAEQDAPKAYRAMWGLVAQPKKSLPALQKWAAELPPTPIEPLIADLDSDDFAQREQASKTLERFRGLAETALRQALAGKPGGEVIRISSSGDSPQTHHCEERTEDSMNENTTNTNGSPISAAHANSDDTQPTGFDALIAEAEAIRDVLRDAYARSARHVTGVRRQKKKSRLVRDTLASLRQLQTIEN